MCTAGPIPITSSDRSVPNITTAIYERDPGPVVRVEHDYRFEGPDGPSSLLDLFDGRGQLILYRFYFEEGVVGWPDAGGIRGRLGQRARVASRSRRPATADDRRAEHCIGRTSSEAIRACSRSAGEVTSVRAGARCIVGSEARTRA